jgi:proteasome lid subunit RPN8/RPN11
MKKMLLSNSANRTIRRAVSEHRDQECFGLLASRLGETVITVAICLPAKTTQASAEVAPEVLSRAIKELQAKGLVVRGFWHSHASFGVFHSHTDEETVRRLLPAMAEWNFHLPAPAVKAPSLSGPDTAILPEADGHHAIYTLTGPTIPGMDANERVSWASVSAQFDPGIVEPRAEIFGGLLRLSSAGVALNLGLPEGASLTRQIEDLSTSKTADVFSLVVNQQPGEVFAECMSVHQIRGEQQLEQVGPCEVGIVSDDLECGNTQESGSRKNGVKKTSSDAHSPAPSGLRHALVGNGRLGALTQLALRSLGRQHESKVLDD